MKKSILLVGAFVFLMTTTVFSQTETNEPVKEAKIEKQEATAVPAQEVKVQKVEKTTLKKAELRKANKVEAIEPVRKEEEK